MSVQLLETDAGEKEVRFASRQESAYPHLMRLCLDFNFRVRQCHTHQYQLVLHHHQTPITPAFSKLESLEAHVHQHMVDILHNYLCGEQDTTH